MMEHWSVAGLKVSNFALEEVDRFYEESLKKSGNVVVFGYSLGYVTLFKKYSYIYPIVNAFDLMVSDGTQFNWFCRLLGYKLRTVISIPDITNYTLAYANRHGLKVLLFGAKPEINTKAVNRLRADYPGAHFCDGIHGYFDTAGEEQVVQEINQRAADILLIGISTPIKENFVARHRQRITASIIIPCGGMIDVYSGFTKQTPRFLKTIGLATPYRIIQEPRRLFVPQVRMIFAILFHLVPLTLYHKLVLRNKTFNVISLYSRT